MAVITPQISVAIYLPLDEFLIKIISFLNAQFNDFIPKKSNLFGKRRKICLKQHCGYSDQAGFHLEYDEALRFTIGQLLQQLSPENQRL